MQIWIVNHWGTSVNQAHKRIMIYSQDLDTRGKIIDTLIELCKKRSCTTNFC